MTTTPPDDQLAPALALADELVAVAVQAERSVLVDQLHIAVALTRLSDVQTENLLDLAADGHAVEITLTAGAWTTVVRADGPANPTLVVTGPLEDALNSADLEPFRAAVDTGAARQALGIASYTAARIRLTIRNMPARSGHHWIADTAGLTDALTTAHWPRTLLAISDSITTVVVADAGDSVLETRHLRICGPAADRTGNPPPSPTSVPHVDARSPLPSPALFAEVRTATTHLDAFIPLLNSAARTLSWYHLATAATITPAGDAQLRFDGARTVDLSLRPTRLSASASPDIALYEWATSSADPALRDAAVHAATLAIVNPDDVLTAAGPALRTAKSLYDLSRRGAVAEAMATRRSAREAALASARSAADTARDVAGKATERALLQAGAAAAVVLTNAADVVGRTPSLLLLALIVAFTGLSLTVAVTKDLPSATSSLDAELADLDQYREALSVADITEIRGLNAIVSARDQLRSAAKTTSWVYGFTIATVALVGGALVLSHAH